MINRIFLYYWTLLFVRRPEFEGPFYPDVLPEPTNWCLVGNIVQEHEFGESKEIRRGSKHFTPGTKVYCLPPQWGDGFESVVAIGIARGSRRWITVVMQTKLITNWRPKVVYKPVVLTRLREGYKNGKVQWQSREQVEEWIEYLKHFNRVGSWKGEPNRREVDKVYWRVLRDYDESIFRQNRILTRGALFNRAVACQEFFEHCLRQKPDWNWAIKGLWYSKHIRRSLSLSSIDLARCKRLGRLAQRRFRWIHPNALAILGKDLNRWVRRIEASSRPSP